MKRAVEPVFIGIISAFVHQLCYIWRMQGPLLYEVAYSQDTRPFVYRALLPIIARFISSLLEIDAVNVLIFLVFVSAYCLYYAIKYLCSTFESDAFKASTISFLSCAAYFLLILNCAKVYDLATGAFFALLLALLARRKYFLYFLLFPLASLNRETTFLLIACFAVWLVVPKVKMSRMLLYGTAYQIIMCYVIHMYVIDRFAGNPGVDFLWRYPHNFIAYASAPVPTTILLAIVGTGAYLIFKGWNKEPFFLRTMLIVLFPQQLFLHLLLGMPWEMRVYAEVFPVVATLVLWRVPAQGIVDREVNTVKNKAEYSN